MNSLSNKFYVLFILMISVLSLTFACGNSSNKQSRESPNSSAPSTDTTSKSDGNKQEFKNAPDFTLKNMEGELFTLSDHEGQVVVLNIWATWCPPCRKEIPDFVDLQKNMQDKGVLFVGVSVDREGWEVVRPFAKKYNINYPIVVDDGTVRQKYGPFRGIPTTFIINKNGKVEYVAPGLINKQKLKPILTKLAKR